MSFMIVAIVGVGIAATAATAKLGMSLAGRKKRIEEQKKAKEEMEKRMKDYENLDTSNLNAGVENQFENLENAYEDLTVNQQQAQFEAQQGAQQRANIMQKMQGAAGGSGIASLAQAMANQGQLATQRASASIGMQEGRINQLRAGEASRLQLQERSGEQYAERLRLSGAETARGLEWSKTGTLLGMSQQRLGAANQARAEAKAQQMQAVGEIGESGMQLASMGAGGMGGGGMGGGPSGGGMSGGTGSLTTNANLGYQTGQMGGAGGGFSNPGSGTTINSNFQRTSFGELQGMTWNPITQRYE